MELRTDLEALKDGDEITLYPTDENPLHTKPVKATFSHGYFYCKGSDPADGPDYYFRDVFTFNEGFTKP